MMVFCRYHGYTSHAYDMGSIMHYSLAAFSANGEDTILPVGDRGKHITQLLLTAVSSS